MTVINNKQTPGVGILFLNEELGASLLRFWGHSWSTGHQGAGKGPLLLTTLRAGDRDGSESRPETPHGGLSSVKPHKGRSLPLMSAAQPASHGSGLQSCSELRIQSLGTLSKPQHPVPVCSFIKQSQDLDGGWEGQG